MLCGGLANTCVVGLRMIETFFGRGPLGLGILIDQLGTYMVLSTLGVVIAAPYSHGTVAPAALLRRIAGFPPLLAMLTALAPRPLAFPPLVDTVLTRPGDILAPSALLSVGHQLRLDALAGRLRPLALGLGFKLVLDPTVLLLAGALVNPHAVSVRIAIFESAMAPMIGAAIVAIDHELDPPPVGLMVGVGIPLSFLTLPVWWAVLPWCHG